MMCSLETRRRIRLAAGVGDEEKKSWRAWAKAEMRAGLGMPRCGGEKRMEGEEEGRREMCRGVGEAR